MVAYLLDVCLKVPIMACPLDIRLQVPPGAGFPRDADRTRAHHGLLHCRHARPGGRHHPGQRPGGRSQEALSEAQRLRECLPEQVRRRPGAVGGFPNWFNWEDWVAAGLGPTVPVQGFFFWFFFWAVRRFFSTLKKFLLRDCG